MQSLRRLVRARSAFRCVSPRAPVNQRRWRWMAAEDRVDLAPRKAPRRKPAAMGMHGTYANDGTYDALEWSGAALVEQFVGDFLRAVFLIFHDTVRLLAYLVVDGHLLQYHLAAALSVSIEGGRLDVLS